MGETKSEVHNGVRGSKRNGSGDAGMESLMTSLGQLALGQSSTMNAQQTSPWDEQKLSSAMYHLLAQSGNGHTDCSVSSHQRVGSTAAGMSSHSQHQLAHGTTPLAVQQGSAPHSNWELYQSLNDGSVPVEGSWSRQNVHYNGSWVANQCRAMDNIPSSQPAADPSVIMPKLRQNSPFPKSLQHMVTTNRINSDLRSCDNAIRSGNYLNFPQASVYVILLFCFIKNASCFKLICW